MFSKDFQGGFEARGPPGWDCQKQKIVEIVKIVTQTVVDQSRSWIRDFENSGLPYLKFVTQNKIFTTTSFYADLQTNQMCFHILQI